LAPLEKLLWLPGEESANDPLEEILPTPMLGSDFDNAAYFVVIDFI